MNKYILSPEEIKQRYGEIKPLKKKETYISPRRKEPQQPRITLQQYQEYKAQGYTDGRICKEIKCSCNTLLRWKYKWGGS